MRINGYELGEEIGRGDTAAVYHALDAQGREVALKISLDDDPFRIRQMKQEADVLAWLKDDAVPECYDYFEHEGKACLVLELIQGQAFDLLLQMQKEAFAEHDVIHWALHLTNALDKLHSHAIPHIYSFLAPAHVMLANSGQVYLLDYGKVLAYHPDTQYPALGLAGYSPPEQYVGKPEPRSDIFSLGVFLYELTTRRDPRISHAAFLFHVMPPRSINPNLSPEFERIVLKAVEHKASERFATVADMHAALLALSKLKL